MVGNCATLDNMETEHDLELKKEAEERTLHRMANVHIILEMWQGSQNLHATQNESHAQNKQMTAVGYISDTEEIIEASWSNFQHAGAAAFKLSVWSTLPPAVSAKDLPGVQTQVLNVLQIKRIHCHQVESDEDSAPGRISDSQNLLNGNVDLDNPNDSEEDCKADNESDIEPGNGIKTSASPDNWVRSAAPSVPGFFRPTRRSMNKAEKGLMNVSAMETRRNKGNKKK